MKKSVTSHTTNTMKTSPYMGEEVETATMPNGAIVNKKLFDLMGKGKKFQPKIKKLENGIYVLLGFSVENTVIIEGETGVIVWDTGAHMDVGKRKNQALREITQKPITAIIYSHNHYAMGTRAFVPEGDEVQIIAHPELHKNITDTAIELGPTITRNGAQHFGFYLPQTGPDATLAAADEGASGYIPPTYGVKDGEELIVDGVRMQFFYTPSDTYDSLTLWLPDHDTVITNSIWSALPNLYTLRGQPYRNPVDWIGGIDKIRQLNPQYLVPEHGFPMATKEKSYQLATAYRDSIAFIYSQAVRGINKGMKPDEIADSVTLPEHLANLPFLQESYGEFKHHLKGIYSGLIGWFSLDAADMNPVSIPFRSERLIDGFGGKETVIAASKKAFIDKEYAWAAELITHVLNIEPENQEARQIKADALRQMGYATTATSSRAFYLTQALALEGKVDFNHIPPGFPGTLDEEAAKKLPIENLIKLAEYKVCPVKSQQYDNVLAMIFTDVNQEFGLHLRKGVAEFINHKPAKADMSIELSCETWAGIVFGKMKIEDVLADGKASCNGDEGEVVRYFNNFEF
jgi:alkyl sulfatase BDS1-like metallo-beta-lactamase superfamily hydrolase